MQFELTRYLSDNWVPVIEKDVDGPNSLPLRLDGEMPEPRQVARDCRRVARTIYLGSAPTAAAAHRGIEDRRVKLGCVMPGESPAVFGDALRRLAGSGDLPLPGRAALLVLDPADGHQARRGPRRAAQARSRQGGPGAGASGCAQDLRRTGDFSRVHPLPRCGHDVPDDLDARLVVLGTRAPVQQGAAAARPRAAARRSSSRAATPRASSATRWSSWPPTRPACRTWTRRCASYLAWESILDEKEALNLDPAPGAAGRDAARDAPTAR